MSEIGFDHGGVGANFVGSAHRQHLAFGHHHTREHSDITNSILCSITTKVARFSRLMAASRSLRSASMVEVDAAGGLVEQHEPRARP